MLFARYGGFAMLHTQYNTSTLTKPWQKTDFFENFSNFLFFRSKPDFKPENWGLFKFTYAVYHTNLDKTLTKKGVFWNFFNFLCAVTFRFPVRRAGACPCRMNLCKNKRKQQAASLRSDLLFFGQKKSPIRRSGNGNSQRLIAVEVL